MNSTVKSLIEAEKKAELLFKEIEKQEILVPGNSEEKINSLIFDLAYEMFGIKKYWHKRIVRCGENTLYPYNEDPKNLTLKKDDILFLDFGPIFEEWEADFGRTYVVGKDPLKIKLSKDIEDAWHKGKVLL
jgi:Xaa-Pro aminopeptidase